MKSLEKICEVLKCDVEDLIEYRAEDKRSLYIQDKNRGIKNG